MRYIASYLLVGLCLTCASVLAGDAGGPKSIKALIGHAECSSDEQCHVIGVGTRACGGPEAYLAWSSLQTSEKSLVATVRADAEAKRLELERTGQLSDCRALIEPVARCIRSAADQRLGRCQLEAAPSSR